MDRQPLHFALPRFGRHALAALLLALPVAGIAADAHQAVKAKPGEIVLIRNVPTRTAYRMAPPGMALIANPKPNSEIAAALGTQELSEADYANLSASSASGNGTHQTTVEAMISRTIGSRIAGNSRSSDTVSRNGISNVIAAPMGAVGRTTSGIGDQVQGALSQLPGMTPGSFGGR